MAQGLTCVCVCVGGDLGPIDRPSDFFNLIIKEYV